MTRPLISICIATYNRADFIGETLDSIVPQLNVDVEVVIIDGASTDNTSDIVARYVDEYSQIKYIILPDKGGVDHDYCKAVEYSTGIWCWLFTDDDLLLPNAICRILFEIKNEYSLIVVNSRLMTSNFANTISERLLKIEYDKVFSKLDLSDLFNQIVSYVSFIGAVVIKRDLWLEREKKRYFGTEFVHVGVIFQAPLPGNALVISDPLIKIRYGNAQWSTRAFNVGMIKWPRLLESFDSIREEVKKPFTFATPKSNWRGMFVLRAKGQYKLADYYEWADYKQKSISNKWIGRVIGILPSIILNLVILFYLRTFDRNNEIMLHDMKKFRDWFFSRYI